MQSKKIVIFYRRLVSVSGGGSRRKDFKLFHKYWMWQEQSERIAIDRKVLPFAAVAIEIWEKFGRKQVVWRRGEGDGGGEERGRTRLQSNRTLAGFWEGGITLISNAYSISKRFFLCFIFYGQARGGSFENLFFLVEGCTTHCRVEHWTELSHHLCNVNQYEIPFNFELIKSNKSDSQQPERWFVSMLMLHCKCQNEASATAYTNHSSMLKVICLVTLSLSVITASHT